MTAAAALTPSLRLPLRPAARPLWRRLLQGGLATAAGKALNALLLLAVQAAWVRLLAADALAAILLATSATLVASTLASAGLNQVATRLLAQQATEARRGLLLRLRANALVAGGLIALPCALALAWTLPAMAGERALLTLVLWQWIAALAVRHAAVGALRGQGRMALAAVFDGPCSHALLAMAALAWWLCTGGLPAQVIILLSAQAVSLAASVAWLAAFAGQAPGAPATAGPAMPGLLRIGGPLMLVALLGQLSSHAALWLVAALGDAEATALFGITLQVYQLIGLTFMIAVIVGNPHIAALHQAGAGVALARLSRALAWTSALPALAAAGLFASIGGPLLALLFGPAFAPAAPLLALLGLARGVQALFGPCNALLAMTGGERPLCLLVATTLSAAMLLASVLYAPLGLSGVTLALAAQLVAQGGLGACIVRRRLGFWPQARPGDVLGAARFLARMRP